MAFQVFGVKFGKEKRVPIERIPSIVTDLGTSGGIVNERMAGVGGDFVIYGQNFEAAFQTNIDKINFYRIMAENPFVNDAIEDIVNEAITIDELNGIISIDMTNTAFSASLKKEISKEFDNILKMLHFNQTGHDIFRRWYIDGQLYGYIVVDEQTNLGIQEVKLVDPRRIKKVIDVIKNHRDEEVGREEYYLYMPETVSTMEMWNKQGRDFQSTRAVKLTNDSVIYTWSGLVDLNEMPLSYLDKALKAYNQLNSLEDANVVYRLTRAPEKLAFYVDLDNMPKTQAESYMKSLIDKFKNKTVYDVNTGKVENSSRIQSMFHNYWMPRRNGKSTEITTVGGIGQTWADPNELDYYLKKLYRAMKIPVTRLSAETSTTFGRSNEITRDELKFQKLIDRYRTRFSMLFYELLRRQLLLKNIITLEDWEEEFDNIKFIFSKDMMFTEMKESDLLASRLANLDSVKPYIGTNGYFSKRWVALHVLNMTEDQYDEMQKEIAAEKAAGEYDNDAEAPAGIWADDSGSNLATERDNNALGDTGLDVDKRIGKEKPTNSTKADLGKSDEDEL